ncbi:MAG: signal recognition particle receptor subunit alpha, partial [Deltaproteobacteria bacterium]|nr:signal recognition particle receptor subunit alpha [Deltaproteobacteria bacterium]
MHVGIGVLLAQVTPSEGLSPGGIAALVAMLVLVGLVAWRVLRAQRGQQQQRMADLDGPTRRDTLLEQATQVAPNKGRSTEQEYLRAGLKKTRQEGFVARLTKLFGEHQLDESLVEQIEEVLFRADLGVKTTQSLIAE